MASAHGTRFIIFFPKMQIVGDEYLTFVACLSSFIAIKKQKWECRSSWLLSPAEGTGCN